jgi:hypothetical protein
MKYAIIKRFVWAFVIISVLSDWSFSRLQEKPREKTEAGSQEIVTLKDKAGQIAIASETKAIYDLSLLEPRSYIDLNLVLMEITKTNSDIDFSSSIRAQDGFAANLIWGGGPKYKDMRFQISIIPHVIEGKGVELKVQYKIGPQMKAPLEKTLMIGNSESAVIELMENKSKESKLMLKITPLINKVGPIEAYPEEIKSLNLEESILTMNDELVIAKGSLRAESDKNEIFIFFYAQGRGLYVISFKPFEGAEKKGVASGNVLRMKYGEDYFEWTSRDSILPKGKWPAWVRRNPQFDFAGKTGGLLSTKNGYAGIVTDTETMLKMFFGKK